MKLPEEQGTVLVTGSAGHLGEAMVRTLRTQHRPVLGVDLNPSPFTDRVGSITDCDFVRESMAGVHAVVHAATLHKPHVATHSRQTFVDTSTTSVFSGTLTSGAPAAWITDSVVPVAKNIYGVTKLAAKHLCEL